MSETTSTNISVAQANSTDSAHAGFSRFSHLQEPASTKRVCFYKSGDPQFNGIKMVVSNRSFKTFDALLDTLSKKVPLPFGVRNISTPRGIHHVTSINELEDGKSYICSHRKKIKPINLERARKKPLLWQSSRPISARRLAVQLAQQNEVVPLQRKNTIVLGSSKKIVIFKNGDLGFKHHFNLNKKTKQSFDSFLDQVAEALQYPVFKLYSSDGRRILSIRALLLSSGTVVAAGRESFIYANYEPGREYLPVQLPGISKRVHPKLSSKQEMKIQLKTDEPPSSIPSGHEHSLLSEKTGNKSSNFVDFSYSPENEISLTEHWPHSGEELPVISPGDNIEKSFHLNSDGTMTVEMKVRFKIKEEETINWSTTVCRADISCYKSKMFTSSVEPAVEAVLASDHSLKTICKGNEYEEPEESRYDLSAEKKLLTRQDMPSNIDKLYSPKKERAPFYRPPTPGIRKVRKNSKIKPSEGSIEEPQIVCNEKVESADNLSNCKKEILLTSEECEHNSSNTGCILSDNNEELIHAEVRQDAFKVLETTTMKLMQTNNTALRPHSAGKLAQYKDNFKFKEIKRSVSASVTFSEPSTLSKETSIELVATQEGLLDLASSSNVVTQMTVVPFSKTSDEAENIEVHFPTEQKKKKKKKYASEQIQPKSLLQKHSLHFECENIEVSTSPTTEDVHGTNLLYNTTCIEENNESNNALERILSSQASTNPQQQELNSEKKLKGNKKMAKVKPRSIVKNYELESPQNKTSEYEKGKRKDDIKHTLNLENRNSEFTSTVITTNSMLPTDHYPLTELDIEREEVVFKKTPKAIKKPQKTGKKAKSQKKKTKSNKTTDCKSSSYLGSLDAEKLTNVHISQSSLETYVQTWLKNIFPNTVLPVIQLMPSSEKEDDALYCSYGQQDKLDKGIIRLEKEDVQGNREPCVNEEVNQQQPVSIEATDGKTLALENAGSQDETVLSVSAEPSKNVMEYFFQQYVVFENSLFSKGAKIDELVKSMEGGNTLNTSQNRQSTDVAVQVESNTITKNTWEQKGKSFVGDMLIQQLKSYHSNDKKGKCRRLEKSLSVSDLPPEETSSPQLLLAWLIVLHLNQGMNSIIGDGHQKTDQGGAVLFSLLQSLKKIAITERADDLKTAVLNLQESVLRLEPDLKSSTFGYEDISVFKFPCLPQLHKNTNVIVKNSKEDETDKTIDDINAKDTDLICDNTHLKETDTTDFLNEENDLQFYGCLPDTKPSSSVTDIENVKTLQDLQESRKNSTIDLLEGVEEDHPEDLVLSESENIQKTSIIPSQRHSVSSSNIDSTNNSSVDTTVSTSKVKKIVQELEQRKYSSQNCAYQKTLQSPISSDWSDYRQDSEDSIFSDTLYLSSEIMTESGEEQVQEKPLKKGFVKRTIERLYGKTECKQLPSGSPCSTSPSNLHEKGPRKSPRTGINENTALNKTNRWWSKENILRSLSSPNNSSKTKKEDNCTFNLKSTSLPMMEVTSPSRASKESETVLSNDSEVPNIDDNIKTETKTNDGVLIDKGRWLLKENHLIRRSTPEAKGMYGHLETTSTDTCLDNTSDDLPYQQINCKTVQQLPLGDISSSEIEDMVKPQHFECNYFNMPHGSDSEPFQDTFKDNRRGRPKTSSHLVQSKSRDSVSIDTYSRALQKDCGISGSLPSFASVDLHYCDNKVHPLPQTSENKRNESQSAHPRETDRAQIKEQDSLDKLHIICGQHCPILTAVIIPVNEQNRGFAYCRPYDIENILFFQSKHKISGPLLQGYISTDENNNNIEMHSIDNKHVRASDINLSLSFDYQRILGKARDCSSNGNHSKLNSLLVFPISTLDSICEESNKRYSTTQKNHLLQGIPYKIIDENNNILSHDD